MSVGACSRIDSEFRGLKIHHKDDSITLSRVKFLKESERGIELALKDFDCFGGETGGYSSWILTHSNLDQLVEDRLIQLVGDPDVSKAKRLEAYSILARRTAESKWIIRLFMEAKKGGEPVVSAGRMRLIRLFSVLEEDTSVYFDFPFYKDLIIPVEKVRDLALKFKEEKKKTKEIPIKP